VVKFQVYWVKRSYKHGNRIYRYRGILLRVPKKFHEKIEQYIGSDLQMRNIIVQSTEKEETINIVLVKNKPLVDKHLLTIA
jgi:transposase